MVTRRALAFLVLGFVPLLLAYALPSIEPAALIYTASLLALIALDWLLVPSRRAYTVLRAHNPVFSIGQRNRVTVSVESTSQQALDIEIIDALPEDVFEPPRPALRFPVPSRGRASLSYDVVPSRRGEFEFGPLYARLSGVLGLARRTVALRLPGVIKVYPNVKSVARLDLLTRRHRIREAGLRPVRRLGLGAEFESLRDYSTDDEFRRIDWKATARRGKPVSREFQVERNQTILIMLDRGRMMTTEWSRLSRLDHAVNAALLLSFVAMKHGDRVGLVSFSEQVDRFVAPKQGAAIVPAMTRGLYDLQPNFSEPDYDAAFHFVASHHRQRSLVVLFSDIVSAEVSDRLVAHSAQMAGRHLVLLVLLQDAALHTVAGQSVLSATHAREKGAALHLVAERRRAIADLSRRGVLALDVMPDACAVNVVNRYLELKARQRI
ncbi:MAG: DUF58 domain-containing protein [Deltaproteobacteria bacterium]|nr:DUF58 domain-containing protein [Deltaproteobacteria bacterium]